MFDELYEITKDGVIHQKNSNLITYDINYVNDRYVKYGVLTDEISLLRLGFLFGTVKEKINKILDVGYGNGAYLHTANTLISDCSGHDISGFPLPDHIKFVENILEDTYDVISFFDVLEHFKNIEFVKNLKCKYVYISVPWCHFFSKEWFMNWKHRKYDEHIWHFNSSSLDNFMNRMGYTRISDHVNIEDSIRKTTFNYPNILTCIYKKN
jgi:hypothetical protein